MEKAAVNRIIAYNEISQLNKLLETNDLIAMEDRPFSDTLRKIKIAAAIVKEADRAYITVHPKGKKATATDWTNVLYDLDEKVLDFHQGDRCQNNLT